MEKIIINLTIDKDNNIIIKNSKSNKQFTIDYQSKILNAQDVYDVFNFEKESNYEIKSDIDIISDIKIKEYYNDIINLFESIKKELNELDFSDKKKIIVWYNEYVLMFKEARICKRMLKLKFVLWLKVIEKN